ncbi:hypothetical protein ACOBV8_18640 (plasmid) [Pseudoalteromonas espejiana]
MYTPLTHCKSVIKQVKATNKQRVGILATTATLNMGIYQNAFEQHNIDFIAPNTQQQMAIMDGINRSKKGDLNYRAQLITRLTS